MRTLSTLIGIAASSCLFAQSILFTEDFEGGSPGFTINTVDVGSTTTGANTWSINDAYTGGAGTLTCFGIPFEFTVPNTPGQPAGIVPQNGNYMHISSVAAINSGVLNASFAAADGFCTDPGNHFSRMNTDVSTVGSSQVSISFWWLCSGGPASYGEVYFSNDQGGTWNLITTPISQYRDQPTWVQQTITLPIFNNQPTLRFGFRFVNGTSLFGAEDPAFSVDNVVITSEQGVPETIVVSELDPGELCQGSSVDVSYEAQGTFVPGNVFTAQLSDALGSFASPTAIGTVVSTTSGTISASVPPAADPGSAYRIRVVSSTPPVTGTPNDTDLLLNEAPNAGGDTTVTICKATGLYDLFALIPGSPMPGGAWEGPNGISFSGTFNSAANPAGDYTYAINSGPPCGPSFAVVTVILLDGANAGGNALVTTCSTAPGINLFNQLTGSADLNGIWYDAQWQPTAPTVSEPGDYSYVVFGNAPCPNDTSVITLAVVDAPMAGTNATATICVNDLPVDLTTLLQGTPDAGGTWTDPDGDDVVGLLDPATAISGLYTYTVEGLPPCIDATAVLALLIDPCLGIGDLAGQGMSMRWSGPDGAGLQVIQLEGQLNGRALDVSVWDVSGRMVQGRIPMAVEGDRIRLDLRDQGPGIYLVRSAVEGFGTVVRLLQD